MPSFDRYVPDATKGKHIEPSAVLMADTLKRKGRKAELITITFIESRGYIWSDIRGATISTNGIHMGLLYKGNVYCNVHPSGLPEIAWIADFHATGKKIVCKTPIA